MKTIEVTDEMHAALMELSKDLNAQSHRSTRMPYMIQVSEEKEVAAYEGCGEKHWFRCEGGKASDDEMEEAIREWAFQKFGDELNADEYYSALDDYEKDSILRDLDYRELEVTEEAELSNFFFTEKALRKNYGPEVNTFLTGVVNSELETVMKFLCELSGGKLHT